MPQKVFATSTEVFQIGRGESPAVSCHVADVAGAGFVTGVVDFLRSFRGLILLLVFGREEGALVMIEPPG